MSDPATALFRQLDDMLYIQRGQSHQTQERLGVGVINQALAQARAAVWEEAAMRAAYESRQAETTSRAEGLARFALYCEQQARQGEGEHGL